MLPNIYLVVVSSLSVCTSTGRMPQGQSLPSGTILHGCLLFQLWIVTYAPHSYSRNHTLRYQGRRVNGLVVVSWATTPSCAWSVVSRSCCVSSLSLSESGRILGGGFAINSEQWEIYIIRVGYYVYCRIGQEYYFTSGLSAPVLEPH